MATNDDGEPRVVAYNPFIDPFGNEATASGSGRSGRRGRRGRRQGTRHGRSSGGFEWRAEPVPLKRLGGTPSDVRNGYFVAPPQPEWRIIRVEFVRGSLGPYGMPTELPEALEGFTTAEDWKAWSNSVNVATLAMYRTDPGSNEAVKAGMKKILDTDGFIGIKEICLGCPMNREEGAPYDFENCLSYLDFRLDRCRIPHSDAEAAATLATGLVPPPGYTPETSPQNSPRDSPSSSRSSNSSRSRRSSRSGRRRRGSSNGDAAPPVPSAPPLYDDDAPPPSYETAVRMIDGGGEGLGR